MKKEFKDILDNFITSRDIRTTIIKDLQSIGFRLDFRWDINKSKGDCVLNYEDRIILLVKDHNILLVDPIKYEKEQIEFIKFSISETTIEDIMYYIKGL